MEQNGHEIEIFKNEVLPNIEKMYMLSGDTWGYSVIFEWLSPLNVIVLNYGDKPQFKLIGIIHHNTYMMIAQDELDNLAWQHDLQRPETYKFNTIEDLLSTAKALIGKEGYCVYHNNGQSIHKCKGDDYLLKHRFKSQATLENTLDIYFQFNQPSYQEFQAKLVEMFDYECFSMVQGYASLICDAAKQVKQIVDGITNFVSPLKVKPRKDAAHAILSSYGETGRSAMAFTLLDCKPLSVDQTKKLFWQCLKK